MFSDDTQLYISCHHYSDVQLNIEKCIDDIRSWMRDNLLILNDSKTEVLHFKSKFKDSDSLPSLRVGESNVKTVPSARNLGVFLDEYGLMTEHITQISKAASFGLWKIGRIRKLLDRTLTERLIHSFITSRLDYCNSLLYGLDKKVLRPLVLIHNSAARLITLTRQREHITPVMQELHWLPIYQRSKFKILIITFKCLHGNAPSYLTELLHYDVPPRTLRPHAISLKPVSTNNKRYYGHGP